MIWRVIHCFGLCEPYHLHFHPVDRLIILRTHVGGHFKNHFYNYLLFYGRPGSGNMPGQTGKKMSHQKKAALGGVDDC